MGLSSAASASKCLQICIVCFFLLAASATAQSSCEPRMACGDVGILRRDCEALGCCWDEANSPRCLRPDQGQNCEELKSSSPCATSPHPPSASLTPQVWGEEMGVVDDDVEDLAWDTSGSEGYEEVEMMVEVQSTEGYGYVPASNVPVQNSTEVGVGEVGMLESTESAEEAEDDGTPTSPISELTDSEAVESRPAPEEEVESDSDAASSEESQGDEQLASEDATAPESSRVTKKRLGSSTHSEEVSPGHHVHYSFEWGEYTHDMEEPSAPPSTEISLPETSESIEEMAMESEVAPDMSEEAITFKDESEELEQAAVPEPSEHQAEEESEGGQYEPTAPPPMLEEDSQPQEAEVVVVEPVKTEAGGIFFASSRVGEESETAFSGGEDSGDLEEPFIEIAWAYGSIGAPESMVEFDLEGAPAAASEISPEPLPLEDEKMTFALQTKTAEAPADVFTEAIPAASPESEPESTSDVQLKERIEIIGSQGFVTFEPVLGQETESVGSLLQEGEDQSIEGFGRAEERLTSDSASLMKSHKPESLETSIQDKPLSITEEYISEFIDTPIDLGPTDSKQPQSFRAAQRSLYTPLAAGDEETLTLTERKAKAKHKSDDPLTNGSPPTSSCATSIFIPCGNGSLTKDECSALGCCWLPLGRHFIQAICYLPVHRTNLDPHVSV